MFNKKIIILIIVLVSLLAISTVSAAENNTDEMNIEAKEISKIDSNDNIAESEIKNDVLNSNKDNYNGDMDEKVQSTNYNSQQVSATVVEDKVSLSNDNTNNVLKSKKITQKTFSYSRYKATFSSKQIKSIINAKEKGYNKIFTKKTGKYVLSKYFIYKPKTIYKTVCFGRGKYTYGFWQNIYWQKGWKTVKTWQKGRYVDPMAGTMYKKCYAKFKKTVLVKAGIKTKKCPVFMSLTANYISGKPTPDHQANLIIWSKAGVIKSKLVYIG